METIQFILNTSLEGVEFSQLVDFFVRCLIPVVVSSLVVIFVLLFFNRTMKIDVFSFDKTTPRTVFSRFCKITMSLLPFFILVTAFFRIPAELQFQRYLLNSVSPSRFFEETYVDPRAVTYTFPDEKRNLIFIMLESMETTYASKDVGGAIPENLIPNLTEKSEENINFSNTDLLGGAIQHIANTRYALPGTGWTVGGMVNAQMGLPLKIPAEYGNFYGSNGSFMPSVYGLGEILYDNGYTNMLLLGSDADFGGRRIMFEEHGNYIIKDHLTAPDDGIIEPDYMAWWGYEDYYLYEYAKQQLTELSQSGQPFNLMMLTADTHFSDGYFCRLCEQEYDTQYANVIKCADRQIGEFIGWLEDQDYYDNTTIVIIGDHLSMDVPFFRVYEVNTSESAEEFFQRTVFNVIINPDPNVKIDNMKNRIFSLMDYFPTTLTAMGIQYDINRLGLGTDLFSDSETILEEFGFENVCDMLAKASRFYNREILGF